MDIAALSINMSQANLGSAVQLSLLKMQMNNGKDMAKEMNKMLENMAVDPNLGNIIDKTA